MGSERINKTVQVKDCGNTHCDPYVGCQGHEVNYKYNSVVDIGTVTIDGDIALIGGDNLLAAVKELL